MYQLDISAQVHRFIEHLPPKHAGQIARKLVALQIDPYPQDCKRLHGSPFSRVDSGEYRIIFMVIGKKIRVPLIGKRNDSDVYRRLDRLQ